MAIQSSIMKYAEIQSVGCHPVYGSMRSYRQQRNPNLRNLPQSPQGKFFKSVIWHSESHPSKPKKYL